jgi:4-hydroxy-2-oxoheptanedioate aldolase
MNDEAGQTRLKQKLTAKQVSVGVNLNFPDPGLAEFLGHLGFDAIVVNAEHGGIDDSQLHMIAMACDLTNCASLLRIDADSALLERYVNLGVTGIQVPRTHSVEQIREVVDAVKFAPQGRRGLGGSRAAKYGLSKHGFPALMEAANERSVIMVQIEDSEGVAALAEIVQIEDVDAVLIGENDLSNDLGVPGQLDHPTVVAAVADIIGVANEAGKPIGLAAATPEQKEAALARGATFLLTSVTACLKPSATAILGATDEWA